MLWEEGLIWGGGQGQWSPWLGTILSAWTWPCLRRHVSCILSRCHGQHWAGHSGFVHHDGRDGSVPAGGKHVPTSPWGGMSLAPPLGKEPRPLGFKRASAG